MSKRFKGKTCVYCGVPGSSTTRDHVLAKKFVLERHRSNLPTAPACLSCNNTKSHLETELTTLLPFGGRHHDAVETLHTMVPKRLEAQAKLRAEVERALAPRWFPAPSSLFYPQEAALHIGADTLLKWLSLVALGMVWHHWRRIVVDKVDVEPHVLSRQAEQSLAYAFGLKVTHRVRECVGDGALTYEGVMNAEEPNCSLWRFSIYGGIEIGGEDLHIRSRALYVT